MVPWNSLPSFGEFSQCAVFLGVGLQRSNMLLGDVSIFLFLLGVLVAGVSFKRFGEGQGEKKPGEKK